MGRTNTKRESLPASSTTPTKKSRGSVVVINRVTPARGDDTAKDTTSSSTTSSVDEEEQAVIPLDSSPTKRKLIFGKLVAEITVTDQVRQVYSIIRKLTGSLGGNASCGPIYGELTMGSMQKMVNLMKQHAGLDATSRFIDVGSGIGKPSLHVAQDPGVEFSYGIEIDADRYLLGMNCLKGVADAASADDSLVRHRCFFETGDIRKAKTFDPFTHVYMFSIGFPPTLWLDLAAMWNRSESPYLICFHGPKDIIRNYEFDVELVTQIPTSMHGSKEGHMGYLYKRVPCPSKIVPTSKCDPLFQTAFDTVKKDVKEFQAVVDQILKKKMQSGPGTRRSRRRSS